MRSVKKFFLAFTVLFTLALCVGCGGGNELVGRYQDNLDPNVVYEFQKGNLLAIETAGDSIATGSTYTIDEEAKRLQQEHGGFIRTMWCGDEACEDMMKEKAGLSSRCMPFEQEHLADVCPCCGKPAKAMVVWGKAY